MLVVMFAMTSVPVESLASEPVRESASGSSTEEAASFEAEDSSEEVVSEEDSSYEEFSSDNLSSEEPVSEEVTTLEKVPAHEEASSRKVSYVENQYENGYVPAVPETYTNVQSCGDYEYVVRDGGAVVTGYVGSDEVIVIPSEMDEYPVTAIGDRAFYEKTFYNVTVPRGVTSIGVESFSGCTYAGYDDESNYYDNGPFTVYLPEGLTDIGERAFENTDIFEIQIPSTILHIGKDAFVCNIYELQFAEGTKKIPDYALYGNVRIDHMNFPKSLEEIGVYAFYGCTGLRELTWPDELTTIGEWAFYGCTAMHNAGSSREYSYSTGDTVFMPGKLRNIGRCAFGGWGPYNDHPEWEYYEPSAEVSFVLPRELEHFDPLIFDGTRIKSLTMPVDLRKLLMNEYGGYYDYSGDNVEGPLSSLCVERIVFDDATQDIPDFLCKGMWKLQSVYLPYDICSIGREAFANCVELRSIEGNDDPAADYSGDKKKFEHLGYIGDGAFKNCYLGLEYVCFPEYMIYIGADAFNGIKIGTVYFPKYIEHGMYYDDSEYSYIPCIGYGAFACAEKIVFPEGTEYIAGNACSGDYWLKEVVIPDSVKYIGDNAFESAGDGYYNPELTIPDGVKKIGLAAFKNCQLIICNIPGKITEIPEEAYLGSKFKDGVSIPSGVTTLGKAAFSECTASSLTIPEGVSEIPEECFKEAKVSNIRLSDNVYSIANYAFAGSSITSLSIPAAVYSMGEHVCGGCKNLTSISFPEGIGDIPKYVCYNCEALTSVKLPSNTFCIGKYAFSGCKNLTSVSIPASVSEISERAFEKTGLTSLKIGKKLQTIGSYAFSGTAIKKVEIPDTIYEVGTGAFADCKSLATVKLPKSLTEVPYRMLSGCTAIEEIEIPEGYTTIRGYAFSGCSKLKVIKLPITLTFVESYAFYNVGLKTVKYAGTEEDFKQITIRSYNDTLKRATKEYMSSDDETTPRVVLYPSSIILDLDTTKKISYMIYPRDPANKIVTWTSTHPEIAEVDNNGIVKSHKVGKTTILAYSDKGLIGTCDIQVANTSYRIKSFSFGGDEAKISTGDDTPLYGHRDFTLGFPTDFPINYVLEDGYIKIGLNVKQELLSGKSTENGGAMKHEKADSFAKEWENFVGDLKDTGELTTKNWDKIQRAQAREFGSTKIPGVSGKVNFVFAGYMEAEWRDGIDQVRGTVIVALSASETFRKQFYAEVPITISVSVSATGKLIGSITYDYTQAQWFGDLSLAIEFGLEPYVGVGLADYLSVGVYGKGTSTTKITLLTKDPKAKKGLKEWSLSGEAGLRGYFAKIPLTLTLMDNSDEPYYIYQDYKRVKHDKKKGSFNAVATGAEEDYIDQFNITALAATEGIQYAKAAPDGTVVSDVYNAAKPAFVSSDDVTLLLYVADDKEREILDQTKLVYSVYDSETGTFSAASAVLDDGTADYEPEVYCDGKDIYVAWLDSNRTWGKDAALDLKAYATSFKVHVAKYNPENGKFDDLGTPQDVNAASYTYIPKLAVTAAGLELVYVENKDSVLFGLNGNNTISRWKYVDGSWEEPRNIDKLNAVTGLDIEAAEEGGLKIAYVVDKDNDLSTDEQSLYARLGDSQTSAEVAGVSSIAYTTIPSSENGGKELAANIGGGLYYFNGSAFEQVLPEGTMNRDSRFVANGDDVYFLCNGDENRNLAVATFDDGEWGTTLLTHGEDYIDAFSVMGDKICYLCNEATVESAADIEIFSTIKILENTRINDIELEDTDFNTSDVYEGAELYTDLYIRNNGTKKAKKASVSVTYGGTEIASGALDIDLMPGECEAYEYSFDIPKDLSEGGEFVVSVTTEGDADASNNSKTLGLVKADLGVHASYDDSTEVPILEVLVENKGIVDSNMTMTVKDEAGAVIMTRTGVAKAGQLMSFAEEYTDTKMQTLTVEVTGDAEEFYLMNNSTLVKVGKEAVKEEEDLYEEPTPEPSEEEKEEAFEVSFAKDETDPYEGLACNSVSGHYETVYTGSEVKPAVVVTGYKGVLREGVDYTVSYSNNVNVSDKKPATVTVTGKGDYSGKFVLEYYILKADLNELRSRDLLVVPEKIRIQSGKKAATSLMYGDYQLKASDYTLSDTGVIKKDTTVDVIGKGNFTGTLKGIPVKVLTAAEVKKLTIKATLKANKKTYDGECHGLTVTEDGVKGELTVTAGASKTPLRYGVDFELDYFANVNAGTAKVVITGMGEYLGTVTKTFAIAPDKKSKITAELKNPEATVYYTAAGAKPAVVVASEITGVLRENVDYKVTYSGNKKVGTGKYTVTFLGNYKGHAAIKNQTFAIKAASFAKATAVCEDKIYTKPGKYLSAPMVMVGSSLLSAGDYTAKYYDGEYSDSKEITAKNKLKTELAEGEKSREIIVVITGKGNYQGQRIFASYKVVRADDTVINLSKAKIVSRDKDAKGKDVAVPTQAYTGGRIEPEIRVLVKKGKSWEEVDASAYAVTYVNNVKCGSATVIVTGNGDGAVGSASGKFKIAARSVNGFRVKK